MLSYWKTSLTTTEGNPDGQQVKAILIEGEVCVDFAEQAGDFCRSIRNLDVEAAHVEIALDIEKATALFKIRIPPKQKLIAEVEELAPAGADRGSRGTRPGRGNRSLKESTLGRPND